MFVENYILSGLMLCYFERLSIHVHVHHFVWSLVSLVVFDYFLNTKFEFICILG